MNSKLQTMVNGVFHSNLNNIHLINRKIGVFSNRADEEYNVQTSDSTDL